jgi:hypothetical protein
MNTRVILTTLLLCIAAITTLQAAADANKKPNIIYILCDDLGYGEVKCLGGDRSKIATPNIDKLAAGGMIFTEAHSSSAVCTPTRYGILTGRYNWRRLKAGVLNGYSAPLIAEDRLTVPAFLKQHGYATACIGKWHLGMDIDPKNPMAPVGNGTARRHADSNRISASAHHWTCRRLLSSKMIGSPRLRPLERNSGARVLRLPASRPWMCCRRWRARRRNTSPRSRSKPRRFSSTCL